MQENTGGIEIHPDKRHGHRCGILFIRWLPKLV